MFFIQCKLPQKKSMILFYLNTIRSRSEVNICTIFDFHLPMAAKPWDYLTNHIPWNWQITHHDFRRMWEKLFANSISWGNADLVRNAEIFMRIIMKQNKHLLRQEKIRKTWKIKKVWIRHFYHIHNFNQLGQYCDH